MSVDITLIIPTYNSGETIRKTLDSVINQTISFSEVLIIDDGSTDDSKEVILGYIKVNPYIKYIAQENAGVSCARNAGIREAQGEYICFLDADDLLVSTMHEVLQRKIETEDKNSTLYHYNFWQTYANGKTEENQYFLSKEQTYTGRVFLEEMINRFSYETKHMIWSYCFQRQFLLDNNMLFSETLKVFEDVYFLQTLFLLNPEIRIISEPLIHYCYHNSSATNTGKTDFQQQIVLLMIMMKKNPHSISIQNQYFLCLLIKISTFSEYRTTLKSIKHHTNVSYTLYFKVKLRILLAKVESKLKRDKTV